MLLYNLKRPFVELFTTVFAPANRQDGDVRYSNDANEWSHFLLVLVLVGLVVLLIALLVSVALMCLCWDRYYDWRYKDV